MFFLPWTGIKRSTGGSGRGEGQAASQGPSPFGGLHHLQQELPAGIRWQVSRIPNRESWNLWEVVAAFFGNARIVSVWQGENGVAFGYQ